MLVSKTSQRTSTATLRGRRAARRVRWRAAVVAAIAARLRRRRCGLRQLVASRRTTPSTAGRWTTCSRWSSGSRSWSWSACSRSMIYFLVKYRYQPGAEEGPLLARQHEAGDDLDDPARRSSSRSSRSTRRASGIATGTATPPNSGKPARMLVIGQQFQWNVIYAGPDGKIGRVPDLSQADGQVLAQGTPDGTPFTFTYDKYEDTKGPADMPYEDAVEAINAYIDQENPLGKVFDDPDGKDDNWEKPAGPADLSCPRGGRSRCSCRARTCMHGFFMPNFRVKLDAVPGLRGVLYFIADDDEQGDRE